jgi:hypothetical protein
MFTLAGRLASDSVRTSCDHVSRGSYSYVGCLRELCGVAFWAQTVDELKVRKVSAR